MLIPHSKHPLSTFHVAHVRDERRFRASLTEDLCACVCVCARTRVPLSVCPECPSSNTITVAGELISGQIQPFLHALLDLHLLPVRPEKDVLDVLTPSAPGEVSFLVTNSSSSLVEHM